MNIKTWPKTIIAASILGAFAAYLSWSERVLYLGGLTPQGSLCGVSSAFNCHAVSISPYATLFGIPLAVLGLAYYVLTAVLGASLLKLKPGRTFIGAFALLSIGAVLFSLYLFYISKFVLGVLCLYCVMMYAANLILAWAGFMMVRAAGTGVLLSGLDAPWAVVRSLFNNAPQGARAFTVVGIISVGGVLLGYRAVEPLLLPNRPVNNESASDTYAQWKARPVNVIPLQTEISVLERDYVKGDEGAKIEIIEFSDFQCGACRNYHLVVERILKSHPGKIRFVNKSFPLDHVCNPMIDRPMHQHACYASNFLRCAGEQGQYWPASDTIFTDTTLDTATASRAQVVSSLFGWAKQAGLDTDGLAECVASERQMKKIKDDVQQAMTLNVEHTPTFYVNGKKTQPDELEEIINILARQ